ncbi:MAG: type II toxin-antitoxin system PemK/MazF family toxin [Patescibacteria group bacterium]
MEDFDSWNELKKKIDNQEVEPDRFPKEGEVWMIALGRNIGFEQNGSGDNFSRPVLVIKKFNNQMFWVVPLSTKQKQFDFYFNYKDPNNQDVSAILAQMKLLSIKRFKRKLYEIPKDTSDQIRQRIKSFL